jgi:hypothetical protein
MDTMVKSRWPRTKDRRARERYSGEVRSDVCVAFQRFTSARGPTTSAFNGVEFGGWLVYCPALDNANFKGGTIEKNHQSGR